MCINTDPTTPDLRRNVSYVKHTDESHGSVCAVTGDTSPWKQINLRVRAGYLDTPLSFVPVLELIQTHLRCGILVTSGLLSLCHSYTSFGGGTVEVPCFRRNLLPTRTFHPGLLNSIWKGMSRWRPSTTPSSSLFTFPTLSSSESLPSVVGRWEGEWVERRGGG